LCYSMGDFAAVTPGVFCQEYLTVTLFGPCQKRLFSQEE
jgi:hypothetical protein